MDKHRCFLLLWAVLALFIAAYSDTWRSRVPMPTARHGLAAATVNGVIYVLAGGTTPGGSTSTKNKAFQP